jgi:nucleoside-diphosphate-sugar epimerase
VILVTGGAGFIGTAVCKELEKRGMQPVIYDGTSDVRDGELLAKKAVGADAIINLAGILGTAETVGEEYEAAEVNILGALNVFDVARDLGIPVVQIATGHEGQPNPYAITKKCITDLALSRAEFVSQPISVVRAYHVYGPGQKMCAPHGHSKVRKIIPSFVARALTGMDIEINGEGTQVIDLVYLDDVAKVIVDALDGPYGEVVEAGSGMPIQVLHAARTVIKACVSKSEIVFKPMRIGEPRYSEVYAKDPLCPNAFPYKLEETIDWYRQKLKQ